MRLPPAPAHGADDPRSSADDADPGFVERDPRIGRFRPPERRCAAAGAVVPVALELLAETCTADSAMRLAPALVAAVLVPLLAPPFALAQNATADGIEAVSRNDPASAARILAPLTASTVSANPIAQFFRAALDETGFGTDDDPFLSCRFYLAAASSPTPLRAAARARFEALLRESPELAGHCDSQADRVPDSTPQTSPATSSTDGRGTRAGVAAFIAGDYETAAAILTPIAERNRLRGMDPEAAFFSAAMYQSGIGLPRDLLRACALYMRGGPIYSDTDTWFGRLNLTLARDAYNEVPEDQRGLCDLLGTIGFDHRFEPATFSLGPGHSVAFTLSRDLIDAAVTYQGRETHEPVASNKADGLRFLPLRYTELSARPPARGSRHFVEIVMWVPVSDTSWQLDWTLLEIVGDAVQQVAREVLMNSTGREPREPLDLRSLVVVRNDDAGRAEWAVLVGPEARAELIPTRSELSDIRAENEARDKRTALAPPRRPLVFPRPPAFSYVDADGCADLFAFAWSADGAEVLTVRANRDALQLSTAAPRTFDLSAPGPDLEVEVRVANRAGYDWGLCKDVRALSIGDEDEPWRAVSGLLTIQVAPSGIRVSQPSRYRASIRLSGAEFVGPSGARVRLPGPVTMTAWVGSFGG
jgi:hypothetical protein